MLRLLPPAILVLVTVAPAFSAERSFPLKAERILFLGDSITHSGRYIAWIETQLRLQGLKPRPELINIGLSSETCSGLSEPDHPFPRARRARAVGPGVGQGEAGRGGRLLRHERRHLSPVRPAAF